MFSSKFLRFSSAKKAFGSKPLHNGFSRRFLHDEGDLVQVTEIDGVRRIRMVDNKTKNSMSLEMTAALDRNITTGLHEISLRCIVISSSASVFSSGHNLKEIANSEGRKVFYTFSDLMMNMIRCPVPIITVVDGLAAAAGCQLVAQSDIVIASPNAKFCTPGARVGVFCNTPGIALARAVPRKLATYMLFTGNAIDANQALRSGLVSIVAKEGELENEVNNVTNAIKSLSRVIVQHGKQFFYKQIDMTTEKAYNKGAKSMDIGLMFSDSTEGLKSFSEKRKPNWKHLHFD
ncbi:enoyl-CoA hydratase domain-containing protein 3, mitochondrial [Cimex lectularius]|uniref:Enoyl-CoA hydratase domain-containing protein 3, mitochondrial n=1 Tax=Cimex lectularius TaxID=79782 RepID=A0A8I6TDK0_CIMLE|nr:enoyl-CoA hydratase domain-containing protein 3, mitochondrial [Cimex lectularius]